MEYVNGYIKVPYREGGGYHVVSPNTELTFSDWALATGKLKPNYKGTDVSQDLMNEWKGYQNQWASQHLSSPKGITPEQIATAPELFTKREYAAVLGYKDDKQIYDSGSFNNQFWQYVNKYKELHPAEYDAKSKEMLQRQSAQNPSGFKMPELGTMMMGGSNVPFSSIARDWVNNPEQMKKDMLTYLAVGTAATGLGAAMGYGGGAGAAGAAGTGEIATATGGGLADTSGAVLAGGAGSGQGLGAGTLGAIGSGAASSIPSADEGTGLYSGEGGGGIDPTLAGVTGAGAVNAWTNPDGSYNWGNIGKDALGIAPNLLGIYGAGKAADQQAQLSREYMAMGAPYRQRLADLYNRPEDYLSGQRADIERDVQRGTDVLGRSLSMGGNPIGSGNALQQMQSYASEGLNTGLYNRLQAEKQNLANFGGLSSFNAAAPQSGQNVIDAKGRVYDAYGATASTLSDIFGNKNRRNNQYGYY